MSEVLKLIPFALGAATVVIIALILMYIPIEAVIGATLFLLQWILIGLIACMVGAMFQSIYESLREKYA